MANNFKLQCELPTTTEHTHFWKPTLPPLNSTLAGETIATTATPKKSKANQNTVLTTWLLYVIIVFSWND